MPDTSPLILSSLDDALPEGRNTVFAAARPFDAAPVFGVPFPLREVGVLFAGETLPCFGLFRGVPPAQHAACAAHVVVLAHEGADRFAVELLIAEPAARLVIARTPRLATLGATVDPMIRLARKGPGLLSRWRGKTRFTEDDVLKVPLLELEVETVRFRLTGGGGPAPASDLTEGRGEMYERYFVCDGPFVVVLLKKADASLLFALWVEDAAALQPR
jgi:hypothetical protein